jgi:FkbM family methyltransferase
MKKTVNKILSNFGFSINKLKNKKDLSFDDIYKMKLKESPIIFDVGANKGQSIERYLKIFPDCTIHAFEPIKEEYLGIKKKFSDNKNIYINNVALGDRNEDKSLNVMIRSGTSSFYDLNENTEWLKVRSKQYQTNTVDFKKNIENVKVISLDNYCEEKKIEFIDLLKIDVQGHEEKVLEGTKKMFAKNCIDAVETEIMFDDVYKKHLSFSDIEKHLLHNFRFCGIKTYNNNLFEGINFFAEILYLNKRLIK